MTLAEKKGKILDSFLKITKKEAVIQVEFFIPFRIQLLWYGFGPFLGFTHLDSDIGI